MAIEVGCNRTVENNHVIDNLHPIPGPVVIICKIVFQIDQAQKEALLEESTLTIEAPRLGENIARGRNFNTRPFSLYLPNGRKFAIDIVDPTVGSTNGLGNSRNQQLTSDIFRVEEINDCMACLRALIPDNYNNDYSHHHHCENKLLATCYCVVVDLEHFIGIQTFRDTYIENLNNCIA